MRAPCFSMTLLTLIACGASALAQNTQPALTDAQRTQLFHPGGINIDVTKAPLADVVQLINEQVKDTKGPAYPSDFLKAQGTKTGAFTLHLKNASFVDVLRAMNEQYPLNVPPNSARTCPVEIADTSVSRPAWSYSADASIAFLTTVNKYAPTRADMSVGPAEYRVVCRMFIDPRVHLGWYENNPHWTVQDDQRHLSVGGNPQTPPNRFPVFTPLPVFRLESPVPIPDRPGTRIVTGKTVFHCSVAEDFKQAEIADIRQIQGSQEVPLGDITLRVDLSKGLSAGLTGVAYTLGTGDPPQRASLPGLVPLLYDGDSLNNVQLNTPGGPLQFKFTNNPMKLKIYYPTKVTPVEVPIEISDIPLP